MSAAAANKKRKRGAEDVDKASLAFSTQPASQVGPVLGEFSKSGTLIYGEAHLTYSQLPVVRATQVHRLQVLRPERSGQKCTIRDAVHHRCGRGGDRGVLHRRRPVDVNRLQVRIPAHLMIFTSLTLCEAI